MSDQILAALGDATRRAMFNKICRGPIPMSSLTKPLKISLAAVAQHIRVLENCGLVKTEKSGRKRICHIDTNGFTVLEKWIKERRATWEKRFDQFEEIAANETGMIDL